MQLPGIPRRADFATVVLDHSQDERSREFHSQLSFRLVYELDINGERHVYPFVTAMYFSVRSIRQAACLAENRQAVEQPQADGLAGHRGAERVDDVADLHPLRLDKGVGHPLKRLGLERFRGSQFAAIFGEEFNGTGLLQRLRHRLLVVGKLVVGHEEVDVIEDIASSLDPVAGGTDDVLDLRPLAPRSLLPAPCQKSRSCRYGRAARPSAQRQLLHVPILEGPEFFGSKLAAALFTRSREKCRTNSSRLKCSA